MVPKVVSLAPLPAEAKSEAEKAEELQRIIVFVEERAAAGKASFQYDLGVRYLDGDGVEQDLEAARKWLSAAANQGHEDARQKLRQLEGMQDPKQ